MACEKICIICKLFTKICFLPTITLPRTPRVWKPNVFEKTFYSQVLEQDLSLKVSVPALRCIDKAGGLDNYIINTPEITLHSKLAIDLKKLMVWVVKCKEEGVEMEQIRSEVFPKPRISRHVHIPKEYNNRFYFDWKGPRKQMVFC